MNASFLTVPYVLLCSIILSLSLGQLTRISFFSQSVNGYLYEIFMALFIIYSLFMYGLAPLQNIIRQKKSGALLLGYLAISLLISSFAYNSFENLVALLYFVRLLFYGVFGIYFYSYLREKKESMTFLVYVGAIVTLIGSVIQYIFFPLFNPIMTMGWDPHQYRMVGTFFDPPIAAAMYGLFAGYFYWQYHQKKELLTALLSVLFLMCLIFTYSRGSYLAALLTTGIYFLNLKRYGLIAAVAGLFLIVFLLLSQSTNESLNLKRVTSIESRLVDYSEAVSLWEKSPLWGIGYNHIGADKKLKEGEIPQLRVSHSASSFHSSFLIVLVTGGVIGLILFIWVLIEVGSVSQFATYAVLFLSVASLTDNVLLHPYILLLFVFLTSLYGKSR